MKSMVLLGAILLASAGARAQQDVKTTGSTESRPIRNLGVGLKRDASAAIRAACPPGTDWDAGKRECVGGGMTVRFAPGTFSGMRAGVFPIADRRTGQPTGNLVIRPDGSGESPVRLFAAKEGGQEGDKDAGNCTRTVCKEDGSCFEYKPLPADETHLPTMPVDESIKLKSTLCSAKFVTPVVYDRQGKAITRAVAAGVPAR